MEPAVGRPRAVAWSKVEPFGAELALVIASDVGLTAQGVALGSDPEPYRLDYELDCDDTSATTHLRVATCGDGWSRALELRRSERAWTADVTAAGGARFPDVGPDMSVFDDALDTDLGLSPLFNSMPVLRHRLHECAGSVDFVMVWISVPDLSLHASRQRYTHLGTSGPTRSVRFESLEGDRFAADLTFDADGIVIDYPGLATRLRS